MFNKKEYKKQWRMGNKEKINEYQRRWRENNPEKAKKYRKKYAIKIKKYMKEYCQREGVKEHREENIKQWRKNNREKVLGYQKKYEEKNPEYYKAWLKTEKGKANAQRGGVKRRARERNIINTLTAQEWMDILIKYKFRCAYCGKEFTLFDKATKDHVIPISKGGDNTKENVVPACGSCNSKKHTKILQPRLRN